MTCGTCICVLGVSIWFLSTIVLLDCGHATTVWYSFAFHFIVYLSSRTQNKVALYCWSSFVQSFKNNCLTYWWLFSYLDSTWPLCSPSSYVNEIYKACKRTLFLAVYYPANQNVGYTNGQQVPA